MSRKKAIESPDKLWELFKEFDAWRLANPWRKERYVGWMGRKVYEDKRRPLTQSGFEGFLAEKGVINSLEDYFANHQGRYEEFKTTCRMIKTCIYADLIEGAMMNVYHPRLVIRLIDLRNKKEIESNRKVEISVQFVDRMRVD